MELALDALDAIVDVHEAAGGGTCEVSENGIKFFRKYAQVVENTWPLDRRIFIVGGGRAGLQVPNDFLALWTRRPPGLGSYSTLQYHDFA
jgi:hypothetical protein